MLLLGQRPPRHAECIPFMSCDGSDVTPGMCKVSTFLFFQDLNFSDLLWKGRRAPHTHMVSSEALEALAASGVALAGLPYMHTSTRARTFAFLHGCVIARLGSSFAFLFLF